MEDINGYTEQCKDWSEQSTACLDGHLAPAAAYAQQTATRCHPAGHPRLADHPLHTVWQTALPVCGRTGAWAQILSLGEPRGETSSAHLYTPGAGCADSGTTRAAAHSSYAPGRAVRHWLRVIDTTSRPVARSHVGGQLSHGGVYDRCDGCQSPGGQHVGTRRERSSLAHAVIGGGLPCARR